MGWESDGHAFDGSNLNVCLCRDILEQFEINHWKWTDDDGSE